jgi:hypothetical protein
VSGAAGLLVGINTGLDPARIADVLRKTGDPITPDQPLGGVRLNLKAAARFLAQPVDLFLLTDMTGSFADDIATFKSQAAGMVQRLIEERLNLYIGLGRFEDYPISPWGSASFGDRAYTRVQDLLPANEDTNGNKTPDVIEAINSLFTKYGEDGPESQLPALYQMATGAGQDVPPPGASTADIPPGQQANWRNNSLRLTILWTDAPFHQAGDSGPFPYPGPTFAQTIAALNTKSIKVIGILGGFDSGGWSHLTQVASGTTTLAPPGGDDCNGDGVPDLAEGQPLVCRISSTGSGIAQAVVNSVLALAKK